MGCYYCIQLKVPKNSTNYIVNLNSGESKRFPDSNAPASKASTGLLTGTACRCAGCSNTSEWIWDLRDLLTQKMGRKWTFPISAITVSLTLEVERRKELKRRALSVLLSDWGADWGADWLGGACPCREKINLSRLAMAGLSLENEPFCEIRED